MLSQKMKDALNEQIKIEAQSSQVYLAMASWAEIQPGIDNVTAFFIDTVTRKDCTCSN